MFEQVKIPTKEIVLGTEGLHTYIKRELAEEVEEKCNNYATLNSV